MKKILITHSYFLRFDPKQWATGKPYAPLGTLYGASVLREKGYSVSFFDTMFAHTAEEIIPKLEKERPDIFIIYDDGFNYLTKMCLTNMRDAAFAMTRFAKQLNCKVIFSSSDSTDQFERYLENGADYIIIGEPEQTLLKLVEAIDNNADVSTIDGIAFIQNGNTIKTKRSSVLKELDSIPFPAWDMIDLSPYKNMWMKSSGYFSMNMATTRGCPFKCNWCAKPIYGNRYNSRSPQNVVAELKLLKEKFNYDHIWFCDDIFGLKPGWVNEFANELEKEQLKLRFKIQARADLLADKFEIAALSRAGCDTVWMGAESGSQKILDAMDKGTSIKQIETSTRLMRAHGIKPCFFIQFGYPGETKTDIDLTIKMINRLLPDELGISVSYPLPGTVFYENVKSELQHKANWSDSDELALMFRNTYQPAFYKQLHRYVHKSYRRHIAFENIKKILSHPFKVNGHMIKKAISFIYYMPSEILNKFKLNQLEKSSPQPLS
ncbi:MAG: radical SAM protein [Ferruginibacter sp.]